ncbi:MAG TPA: type II toxin-antitoxin system YoeB family toxin [Flavobacteriales bacterium]|nr:MAG: type II toxin-antitoxin system YoeB family toxin [Flavobacteriales bacterium]HQV39576.1 type II toxin-antitoxin system YoeB family toxin [Flavobacteriales bacterium]HQW33324.1 type II toxin-antitoxin system YoeB family toxin [Flavobacteriales bacterium]HQY03548.1 type II toxin-antitoxin system YoeB family toxin [Flavobacteriales bacterium]HRA17757.1 type II toxin-antitoxin system YoeB family toxin [Flavobacteriales bacterium]
MAPTSRPGQTGSRTHFIVGPGRLAGAGRYWSRGIDQEHRLVYSITGSGDSQRLCIVQCRFHYK